MTPIGTLNEKPLHAALKSYVAEPGARYEVPFKGYHIDIVQDDLLVEIQTAGFSAIRKKIKTLVEQHRVRLVYPVAQEKWIIRIEQKQGNTNRVLSRRRSPKQGRMEDLFSELVSFPQLINHPNFSLEIILVQLEELRHYAGGRHWRKKGWVVDERRLLEVVDRHLFEDPVDWLALLPDSLNEFTTRDLAAALNIRLSLAQQMAYCLRHAQLLKPVGHRQRFVVYARSLNQERPGRCL